MQAACQGLSGQAYKPPFSSDVHTAVDMSAEPQAPLRVPRPHAQASVAVGCHPDLATAAKRMVRTTRVVEPRPDVHAAYEGSYRRYCSLYPALAKAFHAAASE